MDKKEINIVIAYNEDNTEIIGAFTSREMAMHWYKLLSDKDVPVSIHSVEVDNSEELIMEFDND
jgi:hypothetical protein